MYLFTSLEQINHLNLQKTTKVAAPKGPAVEAPPPAALQPHGCYGRSIQRDARKAADSAAARSPHPALAAVR